MAKKKASAKDDQPASEPSNKTIDQRMADLLKEHQKMGARPK